MARHPGPGGASAHQLAFDTRGTPLFDTTFVVLDLETTGLRPETDRITEVGAVKVRGGEVLGELQTLVHPGRSIPPGITAVTGITDTMVADAPSIETVLPALLGFLEGGVLVAHNAPFDVGFLRAAIARARCEPFDPSTVDTARLARRLLRDEVRDCRLHTLARHLRARTQPEHRALADARATVDVLHGLLERAGSLGATTLDDLQALARSSSEAAFRRIGLVEGAPRTTGVYRFLDEHATVLYVGKATDLRARLRTYFGQDARRRTADLVRETAAVRWQPTATLLEAEVLEVRELHAHRPRYNRRSTTPERAVYLAITREPFPRLSIVAAPGPTHRATFGPLPSRRVAEALIEALHDTVPVRSCTQRLRRRQDHPACVLKELGRCAAPCDGSQDAQDYAAVIERLEAALVDPQPVLDGLRRRMLAQAEQGRFEQASVLRARLHTAARALSGVRRRQALSDVEELVVAAPDPAGTEVAVVRRGRLAASLRLTSPAGTADADILEALRAQALTEYPEPPGRDDLEEVGLVLAWMERPGRRLVRSTGCYAEPIAGGAVLDRVAREARDTDRQLRRDRQHLAADKVVRRSGPVGLTG